VSERPRLGGDRGKGKGGVKGSVALEEGSVTGILGEGRDSIPGRGKGDGE